MRRSIRAGWAIAVAGSVIISGCGDKSTGTTPAPAADLVVHGNDALKFDAKSYTAKAGSNVVALVNDGSQPHTLVVEKLPTFNKLTVSGKGDTDTKTANLPAGTYTIYCDVAGHRSAGMEAELVVS